MTDSDSESITSVELRRTTPSNHIMFSFPHRKRIATGLSDNGHRLVTALEATNDYRSAMESTKGSVTRETLPAFTSTWTAAISYLRTEYGEVYTELKRLRNEVVSLEGARWWLSKYSKDGLLREWKKQRGAVKMLERMVKEVEVVWRCVCVEVTEACAESELEKNEKRMVEEWEGEEKEFYD